MIVLQRSLCLIGFFLFMYNLQAQVQSQTEAHNDFEYSHMLDVIIDTTADQSNIWQVGQPGKTSFNEALSIPNAILTDSLNSYPNNLNSSFYFKVSMDVFWIGLPYFVLLWDHKLDCELGVDGGIIEVSYDSMATWVNIFEDSVYNVMPMLLSPVVLSNGEKGISTISSDWESPGICWSELEFDNDFDKDKVFIRFRFVSDDNDTGQEGWMIDNLVARSTIFDNVDELGGLDVKRLNFDFYPNPSSSALFVSADKDLFGYYRIIDLKGNTIKEANVDGAKTEIDISGLKSGIYLVQLEEHGGRLVNKKFIKQ